MESFYYGKPLCAHGTELIYYSHKDSGYKEKVEWFQECPKCGKKQPIDDKWNSSDGREIIKELC